MFANFKCIQYVVGKSTQYAHNVPVRGVTDDNNTSKNSTFVQEDIIQEMLERKIVEKIFIIYVLYII